MGKREPHGWPLIRQRLDDAIDAHQRRARSWIAAIALQVAVEEYIEISWAAAPLGAMRRSDQPHLDRLSAAEQLALGGFVSGEVPVLAKDLQRCARDRYGTRELDPASIAHLIDRADAILEERSRSLKAA